MKKALFIPVGLIVLIALASLLETVKGDVIPNSAFTPEPTTFTPDMSTMEVSRDVWTSPDGQWVVENITTYPAKESDSTYYIGLIARSADGQKEWKLVDEWIERANDKPSYTAALLWSQDGRSLYYVLYRYRTLNARCKLDPLKYDLEYMDYGQELRKVDLDSGKVTELASCTLSRPEYSPDGKIVAYLGDEEIVLIEINSGEKHTIPFDIGQRRVQFMGYIVWSPDSKAFAFDIRFSVEGESTVWVVDVDSLSARQIVVEGEDRLEIGRWEGPGRLAIEVIENGPSKRWVWDRESDTITRQVIPTKTPTSVAMSTPDLATMEVDRRISTSPDGQWFAETVIAFPHEDSGIDRMYTGLTIRNKDGNIKWQVVGEWKPLGLGWSFPQPIRWSKDGLGLYYTKRLVPDGSMIFPPEIGLYKVNLTSGKATELFSSGQYLSWFALSPNEETVAYIKIEMKQGTGCLWYC